MSAEKEPLYVVRQLAYTINRRWLDDVFSTRCKRTARHSYEQICKDNPDGYFELVEIQHSEQCLDFTDQSTPEPDNQCHSS